MTNLSTANTVDSERPLTYEELLNLAKENYENGGYTVVDCYDKATFDRHVETFGPITHRKALSLFAFWYEGDLKRNALLERR